MNKIHLSSTGIVRPSNVTAWFATVISAVLLTTANGQIDFEATPAGGPTALLQPITSDFPGVTFATVNLMTGAPVGAPVIYKTASPTPFAFAGCPGINQPLPGQGVGNSFLGLLTSAATESLLITYASPVSEAGGYLIDVDARPDGTLEQWTVEANDALGNVIATEVITAVSGPIGPGCGPASGTGPGNARATAWSIAVCVPAIYSIVLRYTGNASGVPGIAFDNFYASTPYPGTGGDLDLSVFVATGSNKRSMVTATAGTPVSLSLTSSGAFWGDSVFLFAEVFPAGAPSMVPGFPIYFALTPPPIQLIGGSGLTAVLLPAVGLSYTFTVPGVTLTNLVATNVMFQGFAVSDLASNGFFEATDGKHVQLW